MPSRVVSLQVRQVNVPHVLDADVKCVCAMVVSGCSCTIPQVHPVFRGTGTTQHSRVEGSRGISWRTVSKSAVRDELPRTVFADESWKVVRCPKERSCLGRALSPKGRFPPHKKFRKGAKRRATQLNTCIRTPANIVHHLEKTHPWLQLHNVLGQLRNFITRFCVKSCVPTYARNFGIISEAKTIASRRDINP